MNILKITGKYLDQPILVSKFKKTVPFGLVAAGSMYTYNSVKNEEGNKKRTALRVGATMICTIASALVAPILTNKIFKINPKNLEMIKKENTKLVEDYLKSNKLDVKTEQILKKSKDKILSYQEVKKLCEFFKEGDAKIFIDKLLPEPENITSREIFSEIGRLSVLGLIPVLGGIFGGIWGDKMTTDSWKEKIPNKIKEGAYQYLANIFLCNVGAGIALSLMEHNQVKSKSKRALGMVGGIITTGVVGGSAIANVVGNKIINPMFGDKKTENLYSERKPEALDIGLHLDDVATVAVMSGLKWIEPALPVMYSVSGYRAGIGYRNANK